MLTSIVILTHNQLAHTQECISSIRQYTAPGSYEIIIVDNASTDGTTAWLQLQDDVRTIYNSENEGFPKGCNQGIAIAGGQNILLLNNDTIVTSNWLSNLLICLDSSEKIGAVGAVTNSCSYYQTIPTGYGSTPQMHEFAKAHNQSDPSKWEERLKLVGFCMLIKRSVIDEIGMLDEVFSPGNYEDDDYSLRIRLAGYRLMLCGDCFIHHFGSVSFKANNALFIRLLNENAGKFEQKWGFHPTYSTFIRHEIVQLVDATPGRTMRVLEVGCACGANLLKIKHVMKDVELYGIELNEHAAQSVRPFANVLVGDAGAMELPYDEGFFDYIIMADVLEHMVDPWLVLEKMRGYLRPDGRLIASIPNVMHISVIRGMLNGNWNYQNAGILDRTHLRFFTLHEIDKMFRGAGYRDMAYTTTAVSINQEDERLIEELCRLTQPMRGDQYRTYQYLVKAARHDLS